MKNQINLIKIDQSTRKRLLEMLSNEPSGNQYVEEIKLSLQEMQSGSLSGILLCALENEENLDFTNNKTNSMCFGSLCIIPKSRKVLIDHTEIILTPKEYDILLFLAKNQGEIYTKEQIYKAVWDDEYLLDDSNIMAFIRKLRKKIEPNPDSPNYIITIWGIGYKFNDEL